MSQSLVQCSQEYRSKLIITSTLNLWPTKRLYIHNSNLIQQKLFRGRQMLLQGGNFFYTCEIGKDGDHSGRCTYVGCSIMHRNMEASQFEEPVNTKCSYYFITCKNPKPCTLSNFARITSMLFTPRTTCPQKSQNLYTSPMIHGVIIIPSLCHPGLQRER